MLRTLQIFVWLITALLSGNCCIAQYSGGAGTENNPFQLSTLDDLLVLSSTSGDWNKHFVLVADIDATTTKSWNNGLGFSPIGNLDTTFSGSLNGNNHAISNLYINRVQSSGVGFFGYTKGGVIKNLKIDSCQISGSTGIGALVGSVGSLGSSITEISEIKIIDCNVSGYADVGGLTGSLTAGNIQNCSIIGTVTCSITMAGGLAGNSTFGYGANVNNCVVNIEIEADGYAGGIIGNCKVPVSNCTTNVIFIKGNSSTNSHFGGVAGTNISVINNCKSTMQTSFDALNDNYIGGIAGSNEGALKNCYSDVFFQTPGSSCVGGISGENAGEIKNSYSTGIIVGENRIGGLIGISSEWSQTLNCYTMVNITAEDYAGGFIGENSYFGTVTNCYSSGFVNCDTWFSGGFVGMNKSTAYTYNCFFDKDLAGKDNGKGMDQNGQNQDIIALMTEEFNDSMIFADVGWKFGYSSEEPWCIGTAPDEYLRPIFYFQTYTLRFEAGENGTLEPDNPFVQTVTCGTNSDEVKAIADDKYIFYKWVSSNGDSLTNLNPLVIENVTNDSTLAAVFLNVEGIIEDKSRQFYIYPNPANSILNIDFPVNHQILSTKIEIIDINGRTVLIKKPVSIANQIDIKKLNPGLYIVKIKNDKTFITKKIIIQ